MSAQLTDPIWYRTVYLHSAHWLHLRQQRLTIAKGHCERCAQRRPLDVHHLIYRELYDVTVEDLRALCRRCHDRKHEWLAWRKLSAHQERKATRDRRPPRPRGRWRRN